MLKEIQSDAFKSHGKVRPPITFENGLNIVKGPDNFENSIGKSTFLMIIDFAFGGNDYVEKLKNVQTHIQDHTINFTFEFDGKAYRFSRSNYAPDIVVLCSDGYKQTDERWSVTQFTKWLKDKYNIVNPLSFRSIVSRFFRVYNRENLDELLPLRMHKNEGGGESIEAIIQLFDLYAPIERISREAADAEEKKKAFTEAQKYNYIPVIAKTKYKANIKRIEELAKKKLDLAERSSRNLLDMDSESSAALSELKAELSKFKRQRSKLYNQLNKIKEDKESGSAPYRGDFSVLQEFFPEVKVERLKTVEMFHKDISIILSGELKSAEKEIWGYINLLNVQIARIEQEISGVQTSPHLSKVILDEYARVDKELNQLKNENDYFDKLEELKDLYKSKTELLTTQTMIQAGLLQESLNSKMTELNGTIFVESTTAPRITFISPKQYEFYTPNDDGTGTNFKGMVVLDLACLSLTALPAIVHDSYVLKQISRTSIEKIFELYAASKKQIFVAFDNLLAYTEKTVNIVNSHTILELFGGEDCLFGKYFGSRIKK
mgnify:CR=1 FL=1